MGAGRALKLLEFSSSLHLCSQEDGRALQGSCAHSVLQWGRAVPQQHGCAPLQSCSGRCKKEECWPWHIPWAARLSDNGDTMGVFNMNTSTQRRLHQDRNPTFCMGRAEEASSHEYHCIHGTNGGGTGWFRSWISMQTLRRRTTCLGQPSPRPLTSLTPGCQEGTARDK